MARVVFFNPTSTSPGKEPLPISLLQLAALLPDDVEWRLVDGNYARTDAVAALAAEIAEPGQTLLAVTVMPGPQLAQAVPTCRALKMRFPELHIVWGGYFPTQHYRLVLESGFVDAVARGPADAGFVDYVRQWRSGAAVEVAGFVTVAQRLGPAAKGRYLEPDSLPHLPYERVPMARYIHPNYLGRACVGYHSSDGCPFTCSFCAVVAMADGYWKGQSAERIATTLFSLQDQYGIDSVQFFDNNFFVSQRRCLEFSERLLASARQLTWWGEGRIDTLLKFDERTLVQMKRSGLKMVFMGAESSDQETLDFYNKGGTLTPDDTLELTRRFQRIGIVPEYSFVLGNPRHDEARLFRDFEYILQIKRIDPKAEIILYLYTPVVLPGELNDEAERAGFRYPSELEGFLSEEWQELERRRGRLLPWGKRGHHEWVREFETVLNAYHPTVTDMGLRGWQRKLLRALASWRYRLRVYRAPLELRALHRAFHYMRPETEGF